MSRRKKCKRVRNGQELTNLSCLTNCLVCLTKNLTQIAQGLNAAAPLLAIAAITAIAAIVVIKSLELLKKI